MTYDPLAALNRMQGEAVEFEAMIAGAKGARREKRKATDYEWKQLILEERRESKRQAKEDQARAQLIAEQILGVIKVAFVLLLCFAVYSCETFLDKF